MRAFQVGTVSARAIKCGFNFDPAKLKTNYLAYERQTAGVDMAKIERVYDVSFNVAKAVATEADYCSQEKTRRSRPTSRAPRGRLFAEPGRRSRRTRGCSRAGAAAR